ncbi:unnamed protein product [Rotaria sp. Silwood2]|nr:unnamed protein product [Rotaria sp. Silwood2]CAF2596323.1 unnamed protein product [Rotaria sp. Silwood2]CAF2864553.1 unnamed protein product [Rotaria sp. Silwood2]CAF3003741.1 unnamed protein product [Rotaria sp. Silwood2]CAF3867206.1 unnamed protein product [Rotaria sp. Silwood2]
MNSKKKTSSAIRLPSLYCEILIKSEFDYRREIRRKLDRIQHDSRDSMRRHFANDHVFAHDLLTKRHQWFTIDKSYRDTCRVMWNRQATESKRTSHLFLPSIYSSENSPPTKMTLSNTNSSADIEENPTLANEKIHEDFLYKQPVMLEILGAPHSSQVLKHKQAVELRKQSALKRHAHIQTTAINDNRYRQLVHSLQES